MNYYCSACGLAVIVLSKDSEPIKACKCQASIIADMSAVTKGHGGLKG